MLALTHLVCKAGLLDRMHANAMTERWSNGQTEGQINRLKTLKRAMYGRSGVELIRARMLPLQPTAH
jgi:transposase